LICSGAAKQKQLRQSKKESHHDEIISVTESCGRALGIASESLLELKSFSTLDALQIVISPE
jgi:hypothetical protein